MQGAVAIDYIYVGICLQHVLPPGLQRIRYYGFLANCHRKAKLDPCRQLLATATSQLLPQPADCRNLLAALTSTNSQLCPQCGKATLHTSPILPALSRAPFPSVDRKSTR